MEQNIVRRRYRLIDISKVSPSNGSSAICQTVVSLESLVSFNLVWFSFNEWILVLNISPSFSLMEVLRVYLLSIIYISIIFTQMYLHTWSLNILKISNYNTDIISHNVVLEFLKTGFLPNFVHAFEGQLLLRSVYLIEQIPTLTSFRCQNSSHLWRILWVSINNKNKMNYLDMKPTDSALLMTSQTPSEPITTNTSLTSMSQTSISGSLLIPILCPCRSPKVRATASPGPSSSAQIRNGPYDFSSLSIFPPALIILSFSICLLGLWSVDSSNAQISAPPFLAWDNCLEVQSTARESPMLAM